MKGPLRNASVAEDREDLKITEEVGVPYGSRTRVAAVKEKGITVIQWNLAAWVALNRI